MGLCHCFTCKKDIQSLGIARHRAMHRDKKQDCTIQFTHGDTYTWRYSGKPRPAVTKGHEAKS